MKIVIPGGSGQVGTILARHFLAREDDVVVLARKPFKAPWRVVEWAPETFRAHAARPRGPRERSEPSGEQASGWGSGRSPEWMKEVDGADAVINLAGRSVNCRYNAANRREITESRVNSVRAVAAAIGAAARPPAVWLQASTATIYAHRFDAPNDETTGIIGGGEPNAPDTWEFSIRVAKAWEAALDDAVTPATRKVALRSAMTMSPDKGGIFDTLLGLVRRGLGGNAAGGRQYVSWIHETDFCRAVDFLIARHDISGAVNLAAPNPLPYADFMRALRSAAGVRIGLPATKLMLEIGALFMRTETELVLKSRRVVPARLLAAGFVFEYPEWPRAARELTARALAA